MNVKLAAILLAVAAIIGGVLFLFQGERGGTARGPADVVQPLSEESHAELDAQPAKEQAPPEVTERVETVAAIPAKAPAPWRGKLAGLTGRLVESDGTPVPGMRVALLEAEGSLLFTDLLEGKDPSLDIEETLTDNDGRFVLGGARAPAFHGLGIDLGGPRATLRVLDNLLSHGERTDIGDVVLAPYGVLLGRVVDEAGAPIPGARIRAAQLPEEIIQVPSYDFRADSLISVTAIATTGQGHGIIELPSWVQKNVDRLPIPTTFTNTEGLFRLEGVALGKLVGGADKRGYVGAPIGPVDLSSGEENLGDLVLKNGRTITGIVEDTYGEPVPGIEVFAGAEVVPGVAAVLQPAGLTNEDGEFALTGVLEGGQVVAAARRSKHEAWGSTVTADHTNVLVELEANVSLTVNVTDGAGEPLSGAMISMTPRSPPGGMLGVAELLMIMPGHVNREAIFREVEPGRYVNDRVTPGVYDILARIEGRSPGYQYTTLQEENTEITLQCLEGHKINVTVLDALTKEPIERARASLLRASASGFSKLDVEYSNAAGQADLGPVRDYSEETVHEFFPTETILLVQHPDYGDNASKFETSELVTAVMLEKGGSLSGHVHWGGAVPTRLYMIILEHRGDSGFLEMFTPPRIGLSDLEGEFSFTNLAPGKYGFELIERFLDQDPLSFINDDFNPVTLYRQEFEIVNGQTTEIEIDLSPTGRGPTAAIRGRVRVDGADIQGATVSIRGNERLKVQTDSYGRFETAEFSIMNQIRVKITGDVSVDGAKKRGMNLYEASLELENGETREIDIDLYPLSLEVEVVDAVSGQPVEGAQVRARIKKKDEGASGTGFQDKGAKSDRAGLATMLIPNPGEFTLSVSADGFAKNSSSVEVPEGGMRRPTAVQIAPSVPCKGMIRFDSVTPTTGGFSYIHVRSEDNVISQGTRLQAPEYTFDIDGLAVGKYNVWIYVSGQRSETSFDLGPEGEVELLLDFHPE